MVGGKHFVGLGGKKCWRVGCEILFESIDDKNILCMDGKQILGVRWQKTFWGEG